MNKILVSIIVLIIAGVAIYQGLKPEPRVESVEENGAPVSLEKTPSVESGSASQTGEVPPPPSAPPLQASGVEQSAEGTDSGPIERPSPVPPDSETLRGDNAQSNALKSKLSADSRIQGAAVVEGVQCDSGTCLVIAKAKASMEQEIQTAFTLFQRDYPEFGSKFKMEISPDAEGVSTFMFAP
ncbi:MAG: hypothetical protein EOP07_20165 [Proteobacteria bacterium]|nr:MAG: hypothetical protein EOP07_20165 [Pseudomonadota bacterium]